MPTILVVDDMKQIVRLMQINLERSGFRVVTASDGEEAMEKVLDEMPDLVVTDIAMPRKDGIALLREIRSNPETSRIPVIVLTVRSQDSDIIVGADSGADAYLFKPFNPNELLDQVRRLLGSPPSA